MKPQEEKAALRRAVSAAVGGLAAEERVARSGAVVERLRADPLWASARAVLGFHPLADEVDVVPLLSLALRSGKTVWLPRIEGEDLAFRRVTDLSRGFTRHSYGMEEPNAAAPLLDPSGVAGPVLVVTPGLAFDAAGNRLGRGKGYYDRFLRRLRKAAACPVAAVAVAFGEQLVPAVPHGPLDEQVDAVVTDRGIVRRPRA